MRHESNLSPAAARTPGPGRAALRGFGEIGHAIGLLALAGYGLFFLFLTVQNFNRIVAMERSALEAVHSWASGETDAAAAASTTATGATGTGTSVGTGAPGTQPSSSSTDTSGGENTTVVRVGTGLSTILDPVTVVILIIVCIAAIVFWFVIRPLWEQRVTRRWQLAFQCTRGFWSCLWEQVWAVIESIVWLVFSILSFFIMAINVIALIAVLVVFA